MIDDFMVKSNVKASHFVITHKVNNKKISYSCMRIPSICTQLCLSYH